MAPKFGTSGLRGLVTDLTDPLCAGYAEAFLGATETDGTVLVGRDLRASSERLARAVAAGAARLGLTALDCGVLPTPALALAAEAKGTAAIMVTGSHIPDDRNGLKFYTRHGEITKADEAAITDRFARITPPDPAQADLAPYPDAAAAYAARYPAFFGAYALGGLRIGVYEHSSAARDLLGDILRALGAETVPLGRADRFIPVDTEAVDPDTRAMLAGWAKTHALDAIVSTDGDADRPMVVDADGHIVPGDRLGPLTARAIAAEVLVTPVSSNTLVELTGDFEVIRTRIGSPYVIAGMEQARGRKVAGYEANGGFLTGFTATRGNAGLPPLMTRDSVLPIVAPLALARAAGQSLAALVATLPARFTAADRLVGVDTALSAGLVADLTAGAPVADILFDGFGTVQETDLTDGFRVTFADGLVVHLRPSGNAPELRVYVEAEREDRAAETLALILSRVAAAVADRA